jgi:hypothetical protein
MSRIPRHLSYANVVASLALFLALGGVGYAAIKLPKNSVGTKQLKNGAVTGKKIAPATVKSLTTSGPQGPAGPTGPQGATGPQGEPGEPGSARAYARVDREGLLVAGHSKGVIAVVPACFGSDPTECAVAPGSDNLETEHPEFCFKLGFEPDVASVTPITGSSYNHDTPPADAEIPARPYSYNYGGCPAGYDASVRLTKQTSYEPFFGFFVVFN